MRTSGSVRAGATGSAQLTFTHVMDEAEARQYMADVDAADQGGGAARQPPRERTSSPPTSSWASRVSTP